MSESSAYEPTLEMSLLGYVFAALAILPLLPFIALAWGCWQVFGSGGASTQGTSRTRSGGRPQSGA